MRLCSVQNFSRFERAALSFVAMFAGWAVFFVWRVCSSALSFGSLADFEFIISWPTYYVGISWLCLVLPLAVFLRPTAALFRPRRAFFFGALCGALALALISLVLFGPRSTLGIMIVWPLPTEAALTGAVAVFVYSVLLRCKWLWQAMQGAWWASVAVFFTPAICVVFAMFVLWPALRTCFPAVTYRFAPLDVQCEIQQRIVSEIKIGDRSGDLHRKLPDVFDADMGGGTTSGGCDGFQYYVFFENGVVTNVQINFER